MYKVLLVDDEPYFRKGLIQSVDWESCGFLVCGEAENGEEAIQKIEELSPDLLITDIRMPAVNGLKLIEHVVTSMSQSIKIFVLSGYDDFSYAQTAIQYGVRNYILKPVNIEDFTHSLQAMRDDLDKEGQANRERRDSIKIISENAIKKLIRGDADNDAKRIALQWLELQEGDEVMCAIVEMDSFDKMLDTLDGNQITRQIRRFKESVLETVGRIHALNICEEEAYRYCVLLTHPILSAYDGQTEKWVDALRTHPGLSVSVFVGEKAHGPSGIKRAYETAVRVRNCKFFLTESCALYYGEIKEMESNYSYLSDIPVKRLLLDIDSAQIDDIRHSIRNLYALFQEKRLAPELVRIYIGNIVLEVLDFLSETDKSLADQLDIKLLSGAYGDGVTLERAMDELSAFCVRSANILMEARESTNRPVIFKVLDYVERNFKTDIYLIGIAGLFQMNPVYLGQLFKKHCGVYFNDYLAKLRITEAKKLLANTDMKISKIAESVGYANTEYFVSRFEKSTSITPTQYRRITKNGNTDTLSMEN